MNANNENSQKIKVRVASIEGKTTLLIGGQVVLLDYSGKPTKLPLPAKLSKNIVYEANLSADRKYLIYSPAQTQRLGSTKPSLFTWKEVTTLVSSAVNKLFPFGINHTWLPNASYTVAEELVKNHEDYGTKPGQVKLVAAPVFPNKNLASEKPKLASNGFELPH